MTATVPGVRRGTGPLPRALHPGAWWLWALCLAVVASRTTNPLLLACLIAVAGLVVARRRGDAPWALSFRMYLVFGAVIVVVRVLFRIVFGGGGGETVLVTLPEIPLPDVAAGIRLLGPVAAEEVLGGAYDGLRLAAMVICVGAANALANPKRLLKTLPGALHEIGTSVVVALSVAPQLVESVGRVRRARRLRGGVGKGRRAVRGILIPVLEDALSRSLALAAAMSSRGYGRTGAVAGGRRALVGTLVIGGLLGVCAGLYGLLDGSAPAALGLPLLLGGLAVAVAGLAAGGRRVRRTGYRPDRWRGAELLTVGSGLAAALVMHLATEIDPTDIYPSLTPLSWPEVSALPLAAILLGLLPGYLTPPPPSSEVPA
ncbi:energy-coupling factor transport system permease protein [Streptomyces zhaozhouensis]|uniref:Energy-coupling factor transport system permease protein n=1 Tax=Streptomyces zhaozhouensis TaxID=1300267 RepID=A0A286DXE7_9ACTN|nr:CbiQ family ECF transporter T component [Streptomyces zhaozhouensis]SOD63313.1 energy-coupling factor transport system permease protein [Streptomyces zhaozhouensis]